MEALIGIVIGALIFAFIDDRLTKKFECEHNCTAQYNDDKHCIDCGKKLKTK